MPVTSLTLFFGALAFSPDSPGNDTTAGEPGVLNAAREAGLDIQASLTVGPMGGLTVVGPMGGRWPWWGRVGVGPVSAEGPGAAATQ